jgi:hypothetical protein
MFGSTGTGGRITDGDHVTDVEVEGHLTTWNLTAANAVWVKSHRCASERLRSKLFRRDAYACPRLMAGVTTGGLVCGFARRCCLLLSAHPLRCLQSCLSVAVRAGGSFVGGGACIVHQKGAGGMHSQTSAQEQTNTHNEQGSKREPPNTRAASERAEAHTSATHHYAREAPIGAPHI